MVVWFGLNFQIFFGKWVCKYGEEGKKKEKGRREKERRRQMVNSKKNTNAIVITFDGGTR